VVGGNGVVASVALDTLAVSFHEPRTSRSLLARVLGLVEDEAEAKSFLSGPVRHAAWLGDETLAIWGVDRVSSHDARQRLTFVERAAGVQLVDVDTWQARVLDRTASRMAVADGLLLTAAELADSRGRIAGIGLNGFDQHGRRAFHLFGKRPFWAISIVGSRAFVSAERGPGYEVVDLSAGASVESVRGRWLPRPLVEATSLSPWDSF
jgi:hypothetical protein